MDDIEIVFEELETPDHRGCDPRENVLWHARGLQFVQGASIHVFHAVVDTRFNEKCAVKFDDLRTDCAVEHIEFHDDRVELSVLQLEADFLQS